MTVLQGGALLIKTRQGLVGANPQISYRWEVAASPDAVEWSPWEPYSMTPDGAGKFAALK